LLKNWHIKKGGDTIESHSGEPNLLCILQGDVQYLDKIREYIRQEYVNKELVTVIKSSYTKKTYVLTESQWKEYQRLKKNKEENLIGAGFP
jgi:hypothetical protein